MAGTTDLVSMLPEGHTVGSIRSKRASIYVFTGGNEDAALLTVNGFSLLLDGGDQQQIPYWNLIRNYDKVSAILATRMSPQSLTGLSTIFARKLQQECYPYFGAFIGNLPPKNVLSSENDVTQMIKMIYDGLQAAGIKANEAFTSTKIEPITLYEVIGEGALRMIVLNPERGSKELSALWGAIKSGENIEKHAAACSLAAVFVWHPADTSKPTIRILYPGACPLEKLYTALEKLKGEEYLRYLDYASANREKYIMSGHANNRPPAHHAPSSGPAHKPLAPAKPLAKSAAAAATATAPATARATKRPTKPTSLASRPATGSSRTTTTTTTTSTTSAGHTKTTTTKATTETAAKKVTKQAVPSAAAPRRPSAGTGAGKKTTPSPTKPTAPSNGSATQKSPDSDSKPAPIRKPTPTGTAAKPKDEPKKAKPAAAEAVTTPPDSTTSATPAVPIQPDSTETVPTPEPQVESQHEPDAQQQAGAEAEKQQTQEDEHKVDDNMNAVAPQLPEEPEVKAPEHVEMDAEAQPKHQEDGVLDDNANINDQFVEEPEVKLERVLPTEAESDAVHDTQPPLLSEHEPEMPLKDDQGDADLRSSHEFEPPAKPEHDEMLAESTLPEFEKPIEHHPEPTAPQADQEFHHEPAAFGDEIEKRPPSPLPDEPPQVEKASTPVPSPLEPQPQSPESPEHEQPQQPDSDGLMGGIEEPMKLRIISMDTARTADTAAAVTDPSSIAPMPSSQTPSCGVADAELFASEDYHIEHDTAAATDVTQSSLDSTQRSTLPLEDLDHLSNMSAPTQMSDPPQIPAVLSEPATIPTALDGNEPSDQRKQLQPDVPLLDSTPDMPVPPVQLPQPELDDSLKPDTLSEQDLLSKSAAAEIDHPEANEDHRSPIEDLLDGKSCPFTAGLACAIVDDATSESAFRKLSSPPAVDLTKNVADLTKPTELDTTGAKIPNGTATLHSPMKLSQRSAPGSSLGDSLTSPLSPDSTNTQSDPALDDVIENLAGESEREDNVRDFTPDSEDEKHLLQQQHCQQEQQDLLHRKTNGGTEHNLAAQHAQEDADAGEFYMPPITGGPTHRMRASVGGPASQRFSMGGSGGSASNKPKLSQPLYFDVVFIPHRGAHPTLPDEAAAKAFATSVRSKRYVISGKDAIKPYILDGLVAGKTLWNKPDAEVDVVPTHESDDLRAYNQLKSGEMQEAGINLRCSVERCTLRLSSADSDDFCAAFKFEM